MNARRRFLTRASLVACILICVVRVRGADWPTYRRDNARTGCATESLNPSLALQWTYSSPYPPSPAWSAPATRPREGFYLRHRVDFDDAFQVAVAGGLLYFGSSVDDKIYALDAATGEQRWSFFTGGPVRLAPALYDGRVLVGSDDGFVYCLGADDGRLIWKHRARPKDEKLLGNARMISRWPIRTGVLVNQGIAYFGAGIFPHENVYLMAVRIEDGKLLWKNDTISQASAYRNDISPQGYLLAAANRLFVPSGRSLPVAFDCADGHLLFDRDYAWRGEQAGGLIGGTYALLADGQIYTGTQNHMLALDQNAGRTGFAWFPGRRLAVVGDMAYMATGNNLVAMNRAEYAAASRRRNALDYRIKTLSSQIRRASGEKRQKLNQDLKATQEQLNQLRRNNITPSIAWTAPSDCDAELIVTANLVLAGGQDKVNAFSRQSGKNLWNEKVQGKARGLAVANGRLYVSTDMGKIYCFAPADTPASPASPTEPRRPGKTNPYPQDKLTTVYSVAARAIIEQTGIKKGYCLVLGAEHGRLAFELARNTELNIIGVEPDPAKVKAARQALDKVAMYGQRVTIHHCEPSDLPYSHYFADLIVSDSILLTGKIPGLPDKLAGHLKPCGGAVCLGVPADAPGKTDSSSGKLRDWLRKMQLGKCTVTTANGCWAMLRRGPLPGAGRWTHQYAEPGNTACSDDIALAGPLGLLWFGEPGPAPMVNRHDAAAAPLAVNGRLFIQGENNVMVYDSYNGVLRWKRDLPGAKRTRLKRSECGNLAASDDSFFVALANKCLRLDAETGRTRMTYPLPPSLKTTPDRWGYLAYVDGIIYGSSMTALGVSDSVFALDAADGRTLWKYDGKNIVNLTIAIGDGWVFFVDSSISPEQREMLLRQDKTPLKNLTPEQAKKAEQARKKLDARLAVALDARTGGQIWSTPVDVTDCSGIGIGGGRLSAMYRDGVVVLCGANANGHYWRQFLAGEFSQRRLVALSAGNGRTLWARDANYRHRPVIVGDTVYAEPWAFDLRTGEQKTRRHPLTDAPTAWQFLRPGHHCGAISACPQMLLMRSGHTSYYDLNDDSGIRHFSGHRLGCWINGIAADGLALAPEASAGCVCLFPIVCSVALEPRPEHDRWGIYSSGGANTPVQHLAVNLGAPGDRRDNSGRLWLGYPRPGLPGDRSAMGFAFEMNVEFLDGGAYFRENDEDDPLTATDKPWLVTSCARGVKRCTIPLRGRNDGPAQYTVTLHFAELEDLKPGQRIFDVMLQGRTEQEGLDIVKTAAGTRRAITKSFSGIPVDRNLDIEFVPKNQNRAAPGSPPLLCAVEVTLEKTTPNKTKALARQ